MFRIKTVMAYAAAAALSFCGIATTQAAYIATGDPLGDGWTATGYSLSQGVYVNGSANYGFDTFSYYSTVQSGSNLEISDGANSWLVGDTIVGVGGKFVSGDAGWTVTGTAVNSNLAHTLGPKLQVKIGTSAATWSASTVAPGAGDGSGSTSNGGNGTIFFRTTGYNSDADWLAGSGLLQVPTASHFDSVGYTTDPDEHVARIIWDWDGVNSEVSGWEMLLNTSLLDRINPGWNTTGNLPGLGDPIIMTVQDGDNAYTNALVITVNQNVNSAPTPEPASASLLALGGLALLARRKRRA